MGGRGKTISLGTSCIIFGVILLPLLFSLLKVPRNEIEAKTPPVHSGLRGHIVDRSGVLLAYSIPTKDCSQRRIYPYGLLAKEIIGALDSTGHGVSGVELAMEEQLALGHDVSLTIQNDVQIKTEELLEIQMRNFGARFGFMAIMDAFSGDLFALTSKKASTNTTVFKLSPAQYQDELFNASLLLPPLTWVKEQDEAKIELLETKKNRNKSRWTETTQGHLMWSPWNKEFLSSDNATPLYPKDLITIGFGEGRDRLPLYIKGNSESRFLATPLHILRGFNQLLTGRPFITPTIIKESQLKSLRDNDIREKMEQKYNSHFISIFSHFPVPALASVRWQKGEGQKRNTCEIVALGYWPAANPRFVFITAIKGASKDPLRRPGYLSKAKAALRAAMELPPEGINIAFRRGD